MPNEKLKTLYEGVSKDYDIGTFDEFSAKLADPEKRKAFYDGVGAEYQLGSFEEFSSKLDGEQLKKKNLSLGYGTRQEAVSKGLKFSSPSPSSSNLESQSVKPQEKPVSTAVKSPIIYSQEELSDMTPSGVLKRAKQRYESSPKGQSKEGEITEDNNTYYYKEVAYPKEKFTKFEDVLIPKKEGSYANIPNALVSAGAKTAADMTAGALGLISDISPNVVSDKLTGVIDKLNRGSEWTGAQSEVNGLPNTIVGKSTKSIIESAPAIIALSSGAAASNPTVVGQVFSPLTKYLTTEGFLKSYNESKKKGYDIGAALPEAIEGGKQGFESGLGLSIKMGLAGRLSEAQIENLASKGLLRGGKPVQALIKANNVGKVFGASSIGSDLLKGEDPNLEKAAEEYITGLGFELPHVIKTGFNAASGKVEDARLRKSVEAVVANDNSIHNFFDTPVDIIKKANEVKGDDKQWQETAIKSGVKAVESQDPNEKKSAFSAQLSAQKLSDIKYVTSEFAKNPDKAIEVINEIDAPKEVKDQMISRVKEVVDHYNEYNSETQVNKRGLNDEIKGIDSEISKLEEVEQNAVEPVEKIEATAKKDLLIKQKTEKEKELSNIINKELLNKKDVKNDNQENQQRVPSEVGIGQESIETKPIETPSGEKVETSGVLQEEKVVPENEDITKKPILNSDKTVNLQQVKNYANKVESGEVIIDRLSPEEERGRVEGGRRNVEASIIAGASEGTDGKAQSPKQQLESLEEYAKKEDIWVDDIEGKYGPEINNGVEATVHDNGDGTVTKAIEMHHFAEDAKDFLDRVALHNHLFPDTKLTLKAMGKNEKGNFVFIVDQKLIPTDKKATQEQITKDMKKLGYEPSGRYSYKNKDYVISDIKPDNVLVGDDGQLHYIDTRISLNTKEYGGGERIRGNSGFLGGKKENIEKPIEEPIDKLGEAKSNLDAAEKLLKAKEKEFKKLSPEEKEKKLKPFIKNVEKAKSQYDKLNEKKVEEPKSQQNPTQNIGGTPTQTGRIPVAPISGGSTKKISQIIVDVTKGLKQRLIFGKQPRGAAGFYSPSSGGIKIKYNGDLDTTAHELGHSIDDNFKILDKVAGDPTIDAELSKFSGYGSKAPANATPAQKLKYERGEGFAEWLRAFVVNPDAAKAEAPNLYNLYEAEVSPEFKKAIEHFSTDIRTFAGSSGRDMMAANIEFEPKKAEGILKQWFKKDGPGFGINWQDKLSALWVNPFRAFEKAFKFAKDIKGQESVLPANDPTILARLFLGVDGKYGEILKHGMIDAKGNVLKDKNGKVKDLNWLLDSFDNTDESTIKKDMEDASIYMISERVVELSERFGRDRVLSGAGGGVYSDLDVAKKALEEFDALPKERKDRLIKAAEKYREFSDDILKYMVDKGRIAKAEYDKDGNLVGGYDFIKNNNLQYVAMQRVMESEPGREVETGFGSKKSLGSKSEPIMNIKGSTKEIVNPFTSLVSTLHKSISEADRNEVLKTFRDMLVEPRGMYDGDVKKFSEIGMLGKQGDKNSVTIYVDGKPEHWIFQEDVYKALKELDHEIYKFPFLITAMPKALRWSVTHFPVFAARNIVRDTQDRLIKSEDNSGLGHLFGDKEHWRELARFGGLNSGYYYKNKNAYYGMLDEAMHDMAKNKKFILTDGTKLKELWRGYTDILGKSETINRVAEYRAAFKVGKDSGMDDYNASIYAAYKARDLMDFAVMGHYMKAVNQVIPFSNAAVRAMDKSIKSAKKMPVRFAANMFAYSVLPSMTLWLLNHKDDETAKEYEKLPTHQRDMFWNYKVGPDTWVSIPKPYELSLPAAAVDRLMSRTFAGNKDAFNGYGGSVAKSIMPVDEGNLAGPLQGVVEGMVNYDFFRNTSIIPAYEDGLDLSLRNTENASRLGKAIQEVSGYDARKIDHFIKSQFSYYGGLAQKLSDIGREEGGKKFGLQDLGFFKTSPAYNSQPVQELLQYAKRWNLLGSDAMQDMKMFLEDYNNAKTKTDRNRIANDMSDFARQQIDEWEKNQENKVPFRKVFKETPFVKEALSKIKQKNKKENAEEKYDAKKDRDVMDARNPLTKREKEIRDLTDKYPSNRVAIVLGELEKTPKGARKKAIDDWIEKDIAPENIEDYISIDKNGEIKIN